MPFPRMISAYVALVPAFCFCASGDLPSTPQRAKEQKQPAAITAPAAPSPSPGPVWSMDDKGLCTQYESPGAFLLPMISSPESAASFRAPAAVEPGFPVQCIHNSGSYQSGPGLHTLVDDMDGDGYLEILVTALAVGPLYAWNHDGTPVGGWPPAAGISGAGYPAMGNLAGGKGELEVFSGHWGSPGKMCAYSGAGAALAGWPRNSSNYVSSPPALLDIDGDGLDEMFLEEEDWKLHAYRADGSILSGWPAYQVVGGQERHTPAMADLDGDGGFEVFSASGSGSDGLYTLGYRAGGTAVPGFPLNTGGYTNTFLAVGDVDADRRPELVAVLRENASPWRTIAALISANGTVKRSWFCPGSIFYGTAPALADLDGDTFPEIVIQTNTTLEVYKGDGTALAGWPVTWSGRWLGNSGPVVGDVDGDLLPDIVVTTQQAGSGVFGDVRAFDRAGSALSGFPMALNIGSGAVPAIADMDLDRHNEIIVSGSYWGGTTGTYDKVWAFDLDGVNYGPVQWGQFGGNSRHNGYFASTVILKMTGGTLSWTPANAAAGYDIIRGDLNTLRATSGNFASAMQECLANDQSGRTFDYSGVPAAGEGYWFLVRATTPLGHGTYDSEGLRQAALRDAGIAASGVDCP